MTKEKTERLNSDDRPAVEEVITAADRAFLVPCRDYPFDDEDEVRLEQQAAAAGREGWRG